LAKHKKNKIPKKSSDDYEKKDLPPTEPLINEKDTNRTNRQIDKLFWFRIVLAVVGGIAATFIFEPIEGEERRWASIGFMIILFIVSIGVAKGMNIQFPQSKRKKIVTTAIGSFVFIYLFMWILTYTVVNVVGNDSGIPSPFT
jgi:hypothetical protein